MDLFDIYFAVIANITCIAEFYHRKRLRPGISHKKAPEISIAGDNINRVVKIYASKIGEEKRKYKKTIS